MEKTQVDSVKETSHSYTALQLGVWRVLVAKSVVKLPGKDLLSALPLILVFAAEVYTLAPGLVVLFILTKVWSGIQSSLILRTSSHLLTVLETTLVSGKSDGNAIVQAVLVQTLCMIVGSIVEWWGAYLESRLQPKVKFYFEDLLLRASLTQDLPTSQENSNRSRVDPDNVWKSFRDIIDFCSEIFSTVTQLGVVLHLSRSDYGGPIFGALCLSQPLLNLMNTRNLWGKVYLVYSNNLHYLRMRALHQLSTESYRHDVISGNVAEYITKEYTKARNALGEVSDEWAGAQYSLQTTPSWAILSGMIGDLPMIYMAGNAILQPSKFSVSSMAILQQTSSSLRWTFYSIISGSKELPRQLELIKSTYDALKVDNQIGDGSGPYPQEDCKNDGMSIDVRDVSFSYPGNKSSKGALTGVSFSIKAGQLVVIVGPNGSGKSKMDLFQRLRDARAGKTMIFVTHRFGHLTKHADLIICMKDGSVAETGTHEELMFKDGDYAKLYNIQASAFLPEASICI
ncbi:hypothetical protein PILCRDRAFT_826332 [Piloderma croceum F 1598]|uniref:ABC transporter domain-containing protein n=1 Tax=Piloderma croceum (strain F 1598) TaxID=765440 RepID=A0A0C3AQY5_PILCF|nr:hypothetical protein PILCRDRAFT_826332 [Piloderma croceum F 1598]